jgi:hypothetical protein
LKAVTKIINLVCQSIIYVWCSFLISKALPPQGYTLRSCHHKAALYSTRLCFYFGPLGTLSLACGLVRPATLRKIALRLTNNKSTRLLPAFKCFVYSAYLSAAHRSAKGHGTSVFFNYSTFCRCLAKRKSPNPAFSRTIQQKDVHYNNSSTIRIVPEVRPPQNAKTIH